MRYHGPQPRQGDMPGVLHTKAMVVAANVLEAMMTMEGLANDQKWALVGALQTHLEMTLPAPRRLVEQAVLLCAGLMDAGYATEWKRSSALEMALEQTLQALQALLDNSAEDPVYLIDLGRESLLPDVIVKELQRRWHLPAASEGEVQR
jgi:hypothetical protein